MLNISNIAFEVLSAVLYLLVMVALPVLLGFIQIHAQKRSSVCIDAKCVGNEMIASKGVMTYEPQFAYDFDNQQYFCGASQIVSEPYKEGQIYEIYVNPKNLQSLFCSNANQLADMLLSVSGFCSLLYLCAR